MNTRTHWERTIFHHLNGTTAQHHDLTTKHNNNNTPSHSLGLTIVTVNVETMYDNDKQHSDAQKQLDPYNKAQLLQQQFIDHLFDFIGVQEARQQQGIWSNQNYYVASTAHDEHNTTTTRFHTTKCSSSCHTHTSIHISNSTTFSLRRSTTSIPIQPSTLQTSPVKPLSKHN